MNCWRCLLPWAGVMVGALLLAACEPSATAVSREAVRRAEAAAKNGDYAAARAAYEQALDGTAQSADIHYRLGLLCDDKLDDPAGALHHYSRCVEVDPGGTRAREATKLRDESRQKLLGRCKDDGVLAKEVARLKKENQELRAELLELRGRGKPKAKGEGAAGASPGAPPPAAATAGGGRTYEVQPGDTLAAISRKFFKTSTRWKDIQDANFQQLHGGVELKPGQVLIIPDR